MDRIIPFEEHKCISYKTYTHYVQLIKEMEAENYERIHGDTGVLYLVQWTVYSKLGEKLRNFYTCCRCSYNDQLDLDRAGRNHWASNVWFIEAI